MVNNQSRHGAEGGVMGNEIETSKTFQEKMFERIRDQLGDLLTEDDLKAIIQKSIERSFFEKTEKRRNGNYGETYWEPSKFEQLLAENCKPLIEEVAKQYLKDNPEVFSKAIDKVVTNSIIGMVTSFMSSILQGPFYSMQENIRAEFSSKMSR